MMNAERVNAQWLDELLEPLRTDITLVEGARRRLRDDTKDSAAVIAADVRAALRQLRADVRTAQAEIDLALAYDRAEYLTAAHRLVDAWRERIDALRIQAELARMDVRDDLRPLITAAENAAARLRVDVEVAERDVNATLDAARVGVDEAAGDLTSLARDAARELARVVTAARP